MTTFSDQAARTLLRSIFDAAIASAAPGPAVLRHLPPKPSGRCVVVGAGKAAAAMASALDAAWSDVDLTGVVVTRYGHATPAGRIEVIEAAHPVPDNNSEAAARAILAAVRGLTADDLVIALISGGGSALMCLPAEGVTLNDKQAVNRALLASGATIGEMNVIRKHLSAIKGGRLAAAASPAKVVTLLISDVPGDDPSLIASGPTLPDVSTRDDVAEIVQRYRLDLPEAARAVLARDDAPQFAGIETDIRLIASASIALDAAARTARDAGFTPIVLGDAIEGEAREVAIVMAGIARSVRRHGLPSQAPAVLLSGGETSVSMRSGPHGRGGRNTEFLLSLAIALRGEQRVWALSGDSDGMDGTEESACAIVTPDTLLRGRAAGLNARDALSGHDSYTFFNAIGDVVRTGPTMTNVNDIRIVLIC